LTYDPENLAAGVWTKKCGGTRCNWAPQPDNKSKQGVDKAPGEDQPTEGRLTESDLKGKKVDRDISNNDDEPLNQQTT
jgi:hypothetical protein